eukprot:m.133185 g.133185  ORF g.133185 m.133185 type:complete len:126 (-) comp17530_c0_seq4:2347-2724(-)
MASKIRSIVFLVRNLESSTKFYSGGLRLEVLQLCPHSRTAELSAGGDVTLSIQEMDSGSEAALSTGYSPFLNFEVSDFDKTMYSLLEMGAKMDGAIQYSPEGKLAALRSPDGHMIGLHEPAGDRS